jgi:2-keto-4-pentenoate hydratase/2-oxohepta-3-ene-1,7-dioic acid hydratase in catechol pathway
VPPTRLATLSIDGAPVAAVVDGNAAHPLTGVRSLRELLGDLDGALAQIEADLGAGRLGAGRGLDSVEFLPPLGDPPHLYMAGANYADHAREMGSLGPDDPIPRPAAGPFFFLRPSSSMTGHLAPVLRPASVSRLDWEIELAAVIGQRAHRVSEADALRHVAAYTIVNDVSARDSFVRDGPVGPMTYDWLRHKGWHTSGPCGPWLVAARDCPDPQDLALRLSVNGELMQDSSTSQMIFSLAEQIAYLSAIVPLVPGDIISTGTCAGVGAGRGRFLEGGDVMVAEIERIGVLENPVVDEAGRSAAPEGTAVGQAG